MFTKGMLVTCCSTFIIDRLYTVTVGVYYVKSYFHLNSHAFLVLSYLGETKTRHIIPRTYFHKFRPIISSSVVTEADIKELI